MHYSVLVIGGFVDEQLEPYATEPDPEFLDDFDSEIVQDDVDYYQNADSIVEVTEDENGKYHLKTSSDQTTHKAHISQVYPTLNNYLIEGCGYEKNPDTGNYGYWRNSNARWDWFEVGGRWQNVFVLKDGAEGYEGTWIIPREPSDKSEIRYIAQAFKKDIDWDTTYKLQRESQEKLWDLMDDKQEKEWQSWLSRGKTKEEYIDTYSWLPIHSVIKDGEWIDSEEDFWFKFESDSEDYVKWGKYVQSVIDECDDEELLTIVDCHL